MKKSRSRRKIKRKERGRKMKIRFDDYRWKSKKSRIRFRTLPFLVLDEMQNEVGGALY